MTINNAMVVPAWSGAGQSSNADSFGFQAREVWVAGETDSRPILSCMAHQGGSWRVSVVGDLTIDAIWGSLGTRRLVTMDTPLVATFAGKVDLSARPRTDQGASAIVTVAPAWSGELRDFRRLIVGAGQPIEPDWSTYRALTASVVNIRGTVVNVPALSTVPLVSGSVLTSGTGYLEFTP
jgi:hypothetical protein